MLDHWELLVLDSIILYLIRLPFDHSLSSYLYVIVVRRFVKLEIPAILDEPLELRCGGMFPAGTGISTWMRT